MKVTQSDFDKARKKYYGVKSINDMERLARFKLWSDYAQLHGVREAAKYFKIHEQTYYREQRWAMPRMLKVEEQKQEVIERRQKLEEAFKDIEAPAYRQFLTDDQERFIRFYEQRPMELIACRKAKISKELLDFWKANDETFKKVMKEAQQYAYEKLAETLFDVGMGKIPEEASKKVNVAAADRILRLFAEAKENASSKKTKTIKLKHNIRV